MKSNDKTNGEQEEGEESEHKGEHNKSHTI